jgi:hypothetical protein
MIIRTATPSAGAIFSDCGAYRYFLWRDWSSFNTSHFPPALFVMLNPSTADENVLDPTLTRCRRFANVLGHYRFEVVNLFAFRSTNPKGLRNIEDPVGADNDKIIAERMAGADVIIVGWGAHPLAATRVRTVVELAHGRQLHCLGVTKSGSPRHLLYLRADSQLIPWDAP